MSTLSEMNANQVQFFLVKLYINIPSMSVSNVRRRHHKDRVGLFLSGSVISMYIVQLQVKAVKWKCQVCSLL